ncbi:MAG: DNA polymerase III subunit beta [Christensenellales bacterium]
MRFTCEKEILLAGLTLVQRAMPIKSTLSALEGFYLEAQNNSILLKCTDLTLQIEAHIEAEVSEKGCIILRKLFFEIARSLPAGPVEISSYEDGSVIIKSGRSKFNLRVLPVSEFHSMILSDTQNQIVLPQKQLREMIRQTVFSVAVDEKNMILTGVMLEAGNEGINMVAIDGYRLALSRYGLPCEKEFSIVMPAKSLNEISRILNDDGQVTINYGKSNAIVDIGETRIITQLLEGEFVKYRQILPKEYYSRIKVTKEELLQTVERASILAREERNNLIRFEIRQDKMIVTSNSQVGNVYEEIAVALEGRELEIAFNPKYFQDMLKVIPDDECCLEFNSNISPCVVTPVSGDSFYYLVLPVRIYGN